MNLTEWRHLNPSIFIQPFGIEGALQVFATAQHDDSWNLWHLSDYLVSAAVSGPSVILVPRV